MSLRYLLDTSTLSAAISARPSQQIIQRLAQRGAHCAIGSVVWNELVYGSERLTRGRRRAELESYLYGVVLKCFPILPYDEQAATWHGRERARLEKLGRRPRYIDSQIAAIARVHDLILVTNNVKDFKGRFSELEVEDWTRSKRDR